MISQKANGTTLSVSLDEKWLSSLKDENFPISIDPGPIYGSRNINNPAANVVSYKSDGFTCAYLSCDLNTGSLINNGQKNWRAVTVLDYSEIMGNKSLIQATINFEMSTLWWNNNYNWNVNSTLYVTHATCWGYNCISGSAPTASNTFSSVGTLDVTNLLRWLKDNNITGGALIVWGQENITNSYKAFDSTKVLLQYSYNNYPNNNATQVSPVNNQVVTNSTPMLRINKATDPDGDALTYYYVVRDQTGAVVLSTSNVNSTSVTLLEGVLKDGQNYTWQVYVGDLYYIHVTPAFTGTFKTDFRLGKDASQTYDEAGPVSVNLQSGNAYTSVASHSMNALGGSIGIGLEYNSPIITREGLEAKFYNNPTFTEPPIYSRIDSTIDFNWGTGSPAEPIVPADNFSAIWKGFFIAPTAGNYKFGVLVDDAVEIRSGSTSLLVRTCCGTAWTATISLQEGEAYPIEVRYIDVGADANIELYYQNPSGAQAKVPSTLLRTAPMPVGYNRGLTGHYFLDPNATRSFAQATQKFLTRNEPVISYDWGTGSPLAGSVSDNFLVRYEGYITPPQTDNYTFTVNADDGVKLTVDGQVLINQWVNQSYTEMISPPKNLNGNQSYRIVLEYYEANNSAAVKLRWSSASLNGVIENKYLSPEPNIVPQGWKLTGVTTSSFDSLKVLTNGNLILSTTDGGESIYTYTNGGYKPPINEDAWIVKNGDNTFTLTDTAGGTYVYASLDNSGVYKIRETSSPYDDRNPAGLKYEYSTIGGETKLRRIIDSVDSSRFGTLYYKGNAQCTTDTATDMVPQGYLCGFGTTDGRTTLFTYLGNTGMLNYVTQPGNERVEFTYLLDGRILRVRTAWMVDVITSGVRNQADTGSYYQFNYDQLGRIETVNLPSNSGASTLQHKIEYLTGKTRQKLIGNGNVEPNGYSKYIEYDTLFRTTKVCNKAALCTTTEWDPNKDLVLSTTDPLGLKSTTIYDTDDKPIESFSGAPTAWFGADRRPTAANLSQVPRTQTNYDGGMSGMAVAYYDVKNNSLFGSPRLHQFGLRTADRLSTWYNYQFGHTMPAGINTRAGYDGYGLSLTGKMSFANAGTFTFRTQQSDGLRLWVDDKILIDTSTNRSTVGTLVDKSATFVANANQVYRIRADWTIYNTGPILNMLVSGPGISVETSQWPFLKPGYNLATSNKVFDATLGDLTTTTSFSDPAYSLVSEKTLDPTGLNYKSQNTFESPGTGFFRPLTSTSAGGSVTSYTYYGNTETRLNTCTNSTVSQAGFPKSATYPNGMIVESIYDSTGRVTASRINTEAWNCTTYDTRGRVTQKVIAANNGELARTIQYNYNFGGTPLEQTVTEVGSHSLYSGRNFLGQMTYYLDRYEDLTTYAYDTLGRQTTKTSPAGVEEVTYDTLDRVTSKKVGGVIYANISYDAFSRVSGITYPQAGTFAFNGVTRDALQRPTAYTWTLANGTQIKEEVTKTQSGVTTSNKFSLGSTVVSNQLYTYDKEGRLTGANYGDRQFFYDYNTPSCGYAGSTKNYNRSGSRIVIGGTQTYSASYCYDSADRLTSVVGDASLSATGSTTVASTTSNGGIVYDTHGNITTLGGQTFNYDVSDRYIGTEKPGIGYSYWVRDVADRVTLRSFNDTQFEFYNYSPSGITVVRDGNWNIVEKRIDLPGVQLSMKVQGVPTSGIYASDYTINSTLGHTLAVVSGSTGGGNTVGNLSTTANPGGSTPTLHRIGPFGEVINQNTGTGNGLGNNASSASKYEYAGSADRRTESEYPLKFITMGARLYIPVLGRFTSVDPIRGGTQNDYVYPSDPIGTSDFSGEWGIRLDPYFSDVGRALQQTIDNAKQSIVNAWNWVVQNPEPISFIPLVGAPSSIQLSIENAKKGDWVGAALNIVGVIPAGKYLSVGGKSTAKVGKEAIEQAARSVSLYVGKNAAGIVKYVGISSNPEKRFAQHLASGTSRAGLAYTTIGFAFANRIDARIAEQTLINSYGLSNLLNKINSIDSSKWQLFGIIK